MNEPGQVFHNADVLGVGLAGRAVQQAVLRSQLGGHTNGWRDQRIGCPRRDLCVVDARLSSDDPRSFADTVVSRTMVDGVTVYER